MYYCKNCDENVNGKKITPGYFLIEVILWFFFIIPGLIYSIWRIGNKKVVCERCGWQYLKKLTSPSDNT